jgi:hypothetical protein
MPMDSLLPSALAKWREEEEELTYSKLWLNSSSNDGTSTAYVTYV